MCAITFALRSRQTIRTPLQRLVKMDPVISAFMREFNTAQDAFGASEASMFDAFEQHKTLERESDHAFHKKLAKTQQRRPKKQKEEQTMAQYLNRVLPKRQETVKLEAGKKILALLSSISQHSFTGSVIIQPRHDAIRTASIADLNFQPNKPVIWVDGSTQSLKTVPQTTTINRAKVPTNRQKASGAAVVYRGSSHESKWIERGYHIRSLSSSSRAEFIAISEGLEVALERLKMLTAGGLLSSEPLEVKIFTDSQGSLTRIRNLHTKYPTEQQLRQDIAMSKLITASQRLSKLGAQVELHWVPGHAGVPGNEKADQVARHAAKRLQPTNDELKWV